MEFYESLQGPKGSFPRDFETLQRISGDFRVFDEASVEFKGSLRESQEDLCGVQGV